MDKRDMFDFHRFCETATDRQLRQHIDSLEYTLDLGACDPDEKRDTQWMLRQLRAQVNANKEVQRYLDRRARR
jgi:hypothetical protein